MIVCCIVAQPLAFLPRKCAQASIRRRQEASLAAARAEAARDVQQWEQEARAAAAEREEQERRSAARAGEGEEEDDDEEDELEDGPAGEGFDDGIQAGPRAGSRWWEAPGSKRQRARAIARARALGPGGGLQSLPPCAQEEGEDEDEDEGGGEAARVEEAAEGCRRRIDLEEDMDRFDRAAAGFAPDLKPPRGTPVVEGDHDDNEEAAAAAPAPALRHAASKDGGANGAKPPRRVSFAPFPPSYRASLPPAPPSRRPPPLRRGMANTNVPDYVRNPQSYIRYELGADGDTDDDQANAAAACAALAAAAAAAAAAATSAAAVAGAAPACATVRPVFVRPIARAPRSKRRAPRLPAVGSGTAEVGSAVNAGALSSARYDEAEAAEEGGGEGGGEEVAEGAGKGVASTAARKNRRYRRPQEE